MKELILTQIPPFEIEMNIDVIRCFYFYFSVYLFLERVQIFGTLQKQTEILETEFRKDIFVRVNIRIFLKLFHR